MKKNFITIYDRSFDDNIFKDIKSHYSNSFLKELLLFNLMILGSKKTYIKKESPLSPSWLSCIEFYMKKNNFYNSSNTTSIPWAYFTALGCGLNPKINETWSIVWPANVGVSIQGSTLKILSKDKLTDAHKKKLFQYCDNNFVKVYSMKNFDFLLFRFKDKFDNISSFLPKLNTTYRNQLENITGSGYKSWMRFITPIEIEWNNICDLNSPINSLWSWGWGHMINSKSEKINSEVLIHQKLEETKTIEEIIMLGLQHWLKNIKNVEVSTNFFINSNGYLFDNQKEQKNNHKKNIFRSLVSEWSSFLRLSNENIKKNHTYLFICNAEIIKCIDNNKNSMSFFKIFIVSIKKIFSLKILKNPFKI